MRRPRNSAYPAYPAQFGYIWPVIGRYGTRRLKSGGFVPMECGWKPMSHTHHIGAYSNASADYQDHLERLRTARLAKRAEAAKRGDRVKAFDTAIETDDEAEDLPERRQEPADQDEGLNRYA